MNLGIAYRTQRGKEQTIRDRESEGKQKAAGKVQVTSLNSYFCSGDHDTTYWYGAKEARVWIKVCNPHSQSLNGV